MELSKRKKMAKKRAGTYLAPFLIGALVVSAMVVTVGSSASSGATKNDTTLTLELDYVPNPDHTALYYARTKGYFARAGLTVKFDVPSTATVPDKLVALDKVDLAVSYENVLFYAQASRLADTAVWAMVPQPLLSIIVPADEHVHSIDQLKGLTIGITGTIVPKAYLDYLRKVHGWTKSQLKTVDVGSSLVESVLAGKVDAIIGGYRNVEALQIGLEQHAAPTVFPVTRLGVPAYDELVVIANSKRLESDASYAKAVKEFVGALAAATRAAQAHPQEATAIMQKDTAYTKKFLSESVPLTLKLFSPTDGAKLGCMSEAGWQRYGSWLKKMHLIAGTPDAKTIMTDKFLPYAC